MSERKGDTLVLDRVKSTASVLDAICKLLDRGYPDSSDQTAKIFGFVERLQLSEVDRWTGDDIIKTARKHLAATCNNILDRLESKGCSTSASDESKIPTDRHSVSVIALAFTAYSAITSTVGFRGAHFLDTVLTIPEKISPDDSIKPVAHVKNTIKKCGFIIDGISLVIISSPMPFMARYLCALSTSGDSYVTAHVHTSLAIYLATDSSAQLHDSSLTLYISVHGDKCHISLIKTRNDIIPISIVALHFSMHEFSYASTDLNPREVATSILSRSMAQGKYLVAPDQQLNNEAHVGGKWTPLNVWDLVSGICIIEGDYDSAAIGGDLKFEQIGRRLLDAFRSELSLLYPSVSQLRHVERNSTNSTCNIFGFTSSSPLARGAAYFGMSLLNPELKDTAMDIEGHENARCDGGFRLSVIEKATVALGILTAIEDDGQIQPLFLPFVFPSSSLPFSATKIIVPVKQKSSTNGTASVIFAVNNVSSEKAQIRVVSRLSLSWPTEEAARLALRIRMDEDRHVFASFSIISYADDAFQTQGLQNPAQDSGNALEYLPWSEEFDVLLNSISGAVGAYSLQCDGAVLRYFDDALSAYRYWFQCGLSRKDEEEGEDEIRSPLDSLQSIPGVDNNSSSQNTVWYCAEDASFYRELGNTAMATNDYISAESLYSLGLACDPACSVSGGELGPLLLSNRCAARTHLGMLDEALHDIERCLHLRPEWAKAMGRAALIHFYQKDFERASALYETALRLDPGNRALEAALKETTAAAAAETTKSIRHKMDTNKESASTNKGKPSSCALS